jgi:hypothetical protein
LIGSRANYVFGFVSDLATGTKNSCGNTGGDEGKAAVFWFLSYYKIGCALFDLEGDRKPSSAIPWASRENGMAAALWKRT